MADSIDAMIEMWAKKAPPKVAVPDIVVEAPKKAPAAVKPTVCNPPKVLPCGHVDWYNAAAHEEARVKGFCCAGHGYHIFWDVAGLTRPVPSTVQRTNPPRAGSCFPGLCCDPDTGFYIGGIGNDCRYYAPGEARCVAHGGMATKPKSRKSKVTE